MLSDGSAVGYGDSTETIASTEGKFCADGLDKDFRNSRRHSVKLKIPDQHCNWLFLGLVNRESEIKRKQKDVWTDRPARKLSAQPLTTWGGSMRGHQSPPRPAAAI